MDVRMMFEGEVPWEEDEGTRPDGDVFDSLGLWDEEAVDGLGHHTSEARTDVTETSLADTRAEAGGSWGLGPASASPAVVHARRRLPVPDLAADTTGVHHHAAELVQRSSGEDMRYELARRLRQWQSVDAERADAEHTCGEEEEDRRVDLEDVEDTYHIQDDGSSPEAVDAEGAVRSPCRRVGREWADSSKVVNVMGPGIGKSEWLVGGGVAKRESETAAYPITQRNGICASRRVPVRRRIMPLLLLVRIGGHWRVEVGDGGEGSV
ncbi:MAG: hypothetical protein Q9224_001102 [Gallowayella concinna]